MLINFRYVLKGMTSLTSRRPVKFNKKTNHTNKRVDIATYFNRVGGYLGSSTKAYYSSLPHSQRQQIKKTLSDELCVDARK